MNNIICMLSFVLSIGNFLPEKVNLISFGSGCSYENGSSLLAVVLISIAWGLYCGLPTLVLYKVAIYARQNRGKRPISCL